MSRLFLSHSSANNAEAIALRDWLSSEGWDDVFLDLDPERGIVAGQRWERALHEAATRCEAVIFLASKPWLASQWCLREFQLAQKLNKQIFVGIVDETRIGDLPLTMRATWQVVELGRGQDHEIRRVLCPDGDERHVSFSRSGLRKLRNGLAKAGLDPRFFAWPPPNDPKRTPYRGMLPLEAEDAGIFFGREAPTIAVLDRLRGMKDGAPPRLLTILGASGAGKSSFLRAGLLPRLARDDRNFLPLPVVRSGRAAITGDTGFVASLVAAMTAKEISCTRANMEKIVDQGPEAVAECLSRLAGSATPPALGDGLQPMPPTIVLPIDQAEELFTADEKDEAKWFLKLVAELALRTTPKLLVISTIRSDAFEHLQTAMELEGLPQETFSLSPLPKGAYQMVIEGPINRLKETNRPLVIEPALTQALLQEIGEGVSKDALPLLAFTLERLHERHGGDGDLLLSEYREFGGLRGSIQSAVERALEAADKDVAVPRDKDERLVLLRRAFIPWMAGVDPETRVPRKRVARLSKIPPEARPLIQHFVDQRLLTTDKSEQLGEQTVEPAHEALLRQWNLLETWLKEDAAALAALESVKAAAREWEPNGRNSSWLAHSASRLEDAERHARRSDLGAYLDDVDRAYLGACRAADTAARQREQQSARRIKFAAIAASVLAILAAGAAYYGFSESSRAREQSALLAPASSSDMLAKGDVDGALLVLLDAFTAFDPSATPHALQIAMHDALEVAADQTTLQTNTPSLLVFGPDGLFYVIEKSRDRFWTLNGNVLTLEYEGARTTVSALEARYIPSTKKLIVVREDGTVETVSESGFASIGKLQHMQNELPSVQILNSGFVFSQDFSDDEVNLSILDTASGLLHNQTFDNRRLEAVDYDGVPYLITSTYVGDGQEIKVSGQRVSRVDEKILFAAPDSVKDFAVRSQLCNSLYKPIDPKMYKLIAEQINNFMTNHSYICVSLGDRLLFSYAMGSSAGDQRGFYLLDSNGKEKDVVFDGVLPVPADQIAVSNNGKVVAIVSDRIVKLYDITSFHPDEASSAEGASGEDGASGEEGAASAENAPNAEGAPGQEAAASEGAAVEVAAGEGEASDKDAAGDEAAATGEDADENDSSAEEGKFSLVREITFETPPDKVVFDGGRLLAFEERAGRVTLIGSEEGDFVDLYRAGIEKRQKEESTFDRMNPGNCTDVTDSIRPLWKNENFSAKWIRSEEDNGRLEIRGGDAVSVLDLKDYHCFQFSRDLTLVLFSDARKIVVYDVKDLLRKGIATASPKFALHGDWASAFFLDDYSLVVADNSLEVKRYWIKESGVSHQTIFRGSKPITYAEPSENGKRLIIIESMGSGDVSAKLVSLENGEEWATLGESYKWRSAFFLPDGQIVNGQTGAMNILALPQPDALAIEARRELSSHCAIRDNQMPQDSPCWPAR